MNISIGQLDPPAVQVLIVCAVVLAGGSLTRLWLLRGSHDRKARQRRAGLIVWWTLLFAVFGSAAVGPWAIGGLLCVVTMYAWWEYVPWVCRDGGDRWVAGIGLVLAPLHYGAIVASRHEPSWVLLPVGGLLLLGSIQVLRGITKGFIRATAGLYWGMMTIIFLPSFVVRLALVPPGGTAAASGWYLYVMLLTPLSDIVQALVGRRWGRHAITPTVSPHKTWEGFIGGMIGTGIASVMLAPFVTPWDWRGAAGSSIDVGVLLTAFGCGIVLSGAGLLGDIHLSAVKRDVGVKDSGDLLPGQGGMIDRIDSLTFTGTVCFLLISSGWLG